LYTNLLKDTEHIYNLCQQFHTNNLVKPNLRFRDFYNEFKLKFDVSKTHTQKLESHLTYIDFLKENVILTSTDGHQVKWFHGFDELMADIKKITDWYAFIVNTYKKSIEYDSRKLINNSKGDLKIWADFKIMRKQLGTDEKLNRFLEERRDISTNEQIDLNNLIDAIKSSLEYSCDDQSKLVVKDNIIELSKVKMELFSKCPLFKELFVFATQTVFIDESLEEPEKNVYIVAPVWKIVGTRKINLQGNEAVPQKENRGREGEPGNPGQPGGNFVGFGDKFFNEKSLTIDVLGGKGGDGADGAKGENGHDGKDAQKKEDYRRDIYYDEQSQSGKLFGTDGTNGHRGLDGGKPGYGGKSGNIYVNSQNIIKRAYNGENGAAGSGGKGGKGGQHGKTIKCPYRKGVWNWYYDCDTSNLEYRGKATDGDDGVSGAAGYPVNATQPQSFTPLDTVAHLYNQFNENNHPSLNLWSPSTAIFSKIENDDQLTQSIQHR
jgi:hypothetical protein